MRRAIRSTGKILGLALMLATLGLTASQMLGGPVSIVMVEGSSMRPAYRDGDLVLVRRAGSYGIGDAVAYRSRQLGSVVLHRIVSQPSGLLVLKGDNNDWVDPELPSVDAVLGKHWLRVPAIGGALKRLRTPLGIATGAGALGALAVARAALRRRKHHRGGGAVRGEILGSRLISRRGPSLAIAGCAAVGAMSLALGAASFILREKEPDNISYRHTGGFSYAAEVRRTPVYQKTDVVTGEPIYLNLAPSLEVAFTYRFESDVPHEVSGQAGLYAEITDVSGWKHTLRLQPDASFNGDRSRLRATLDTKALWRVIDEFERLTGIRNASYTVSVFPEIHTRGTLANRTFDAAFSPRLAFQLDRVQLRLVPAVSGPTPEDAPVADPLRPTEEGTLPGPTSAGVTVRLGGVRIDAGALTRTGLAGAAASTIGLVLLLSRRRPKERNDETSRILRRYRQWIIPVHMAPACAAGGAPVDVTSIESLLRLADRYGRMVLHAAEDDQWFFVEDDGTLYRYRATRLDERGSGENAFPSDHPTADPSNPRAFGARSHA